MQIENRRAGGIEAKMSRVGRKRNRFIGWLPAIAFNGFVVVLQQISFSVCHR